MRRKRVTIDIVEVEHAAVHDFHDGRAQRRGRGGQVGRRDAPRIGHKVAKTVVNDKVACAAFICLAHQRRVELRRVCPHRGAKVMAQMWHQNANCRVAVQAPALMFGSLGERLLALCGGHIHLVETRCEVSGETRLHATAQADELTERHAAAEPSKIPRIDEIAQPRAHSRGRL